MSLTFATGGNLLHINMHNRVRTRIADEFRKKRYQVSEEVHCVSETGSNRRIDMMVINNLTKQGFVIDPTIRFEINSEYSEVVHREKCGIYNPCIPYLLDKFKLDQIEVIGLFVGVRGTITLFFENFRKRFNLPKSLRDDIVLIVLKGASQILNNHLYSNTN
jgi:hypothetical protein